MIGNVLAIYNLFVKHRELNDFDIERLIDINPNSIRSSRLKLEELGIIKRTNVKKKATKGVAKDSRGRYTIYQLVKEVNPDSIKRKKSKKISRTSILAKIKGLRKKIKNIEKELSRFVSSLVVK